jgi:hypothetical protein
LVGGAVEYKDNEDPDAEFEVHSIVDEVLIDKKKFVLVKWKGYELDVEDWSPVGAVKHLDLYKVRHPSSSLFPNTVGENTTAVDGQINSYNVTMAVTIFSCPSAADTAVAMLHSAQRSHYSRRYEMNYFENSFQRILHAKSRQ